VEKQFFFSIKESPNPSHLEGFSYAPSVVESSSCVEYLCERAAYLYFMGGGGWKCELGWPLTFSVYSSRRVKLGSCAVFVLDSSTPPAFDMIKVGGQCA